MRLKDVTTMNALTLPETTASDYAFQYIDIGSVMATETSRWASESRLMAHPLARGAL